MYRAIAIPLLALAACATPPHPWSHTRLCELERAGGAGEVEPDAWLELLLRGYDPQTRRATSPAVDCTGTQVRWDGPALACADGSMARAVLPDRPLGGEDVIVSTLGPDLRAVWIVTNRFASGDALGPVAIVEVQRSRLVVRAAGALRANPLRARLRLEKLGAGEALVAEGEQCGSADPASCVRSARVMTIARDQIAPAVLQNDAGACVMPAWFHLGREEREKLASGWQRRYRLAATLGFDDPAGLRLSEQVVVDDVDPRQPTAPPRPFRKAELDTRVRLDAGRLVADAPPLWERVRAAR